MSDDIVKRLLAKQIDSLYDEIERLRDGIAEHKRVALRANWLATQNADRRLWALIEEDDDCHFGHASTVYDGRRGTETTVLIEEDDDE